MNSTNIEKRVDLNKSVHTAGEAALQSGGVKTLVTSDLPASEVIGTLSKRVREAKHVSENYGYLASKLFSKNMVFDGVLDVTYSELAATDSTNPYADVVIGDFNAGDNKALRFTYEAKTQSNVKTRILNDVLMNFKTNPSDAVASIFKGTENIIKSQALKWAEQAWTVLASRTFTVDVSGAADDIEVNKEIYKTLIEFRKNSKQHNGVGTDVAVPGEIKDADGNTITPTYKFNSKDFYLLTTPEFTTNTVFDGERSFFNWNGSQIQLAGTYDLFLDDEEMPSAVSTQWESAKAILVHKNAVMGIQDWEGTGLADAGKLYTVFHNYMKQDPIVRYDAPVIMFGGTSTPETKKA